MHLIYCSAQTCWTKSDRLCTYGIVECKHVGTCVDQKRDNHVVGSSTCPVQRCVTCARLFHARARVEGEQETGWVRPGNKQTNTSSSSTQ